MNMNNKLPNIAIVGNAADDKCDLLNSILGEEELPELCNITLYGADGQPEKMALHDAVEDWRNGNIQGIVCLPFASDVMEALNECLGEGAEQMVGLYVTAGMKMASVMGSMAETEAMSQITKEAVVTRVKQIAGILKRDFLISNPRIAVSFIKEDEAKDADEDRKDIAAEAVGELSKSGVLAFGPVNGGVFFDKGDHQAYDALVEVYDGQYMECMVNTTDDAPLKVMTGVDIPAVSAQYEGVLHAIFMVLDMMRNRKMYDEPFANPLQKLYRERREDGDKARFAVKKKGFNPAEHRRENVNYTTATAPKPPKQA